MSLLTEQEITEIVREAAREAQHDETDQPRSESQEPSTR